MKKRSLFIAVALACLFGVPASIYFWLIVPVSWEKVDTVTIQWLHGGYGVTTLNSFDNKDTVKDLHGLIFSPKPGLARIDNRQLADPKWVITFQSGERRITVLGASNGFAYRKMIASGDGDETGWYFQQASLPVAEQLQTSFFTSMVEPKKVLPLRGLSKSEKQEGQLAQFITTRMMNDQGGVYTNYRDDRPELKDEARNHDILAESTGLLLEYALWSDDKELYQQQVAYVRKYLVGPFGVLAWKVNEDNLKPQPASALIDDIRVAATLIQGYNKWQDTRDLELAKSILHAVYRFEQQDGQWRSWFDWMIIPGGWKAWFADVQPNGSPVVPVRYLQPAYLNIVATVDPRFADLAPRSLEMIKKADLGNGLFATEYSVEKGPVQEKPDVNMVDSLLSALHGAQVGYISQPTINFLRGELKKGRIFASYQKDLQQKGLRQVLVPSSSVQSPAVYSLAALFLWQAGEQELARVAVDHLLLHRISDEKTIFFGGFGDPRTGDCYSFDNLLALQALAVVGSR